MQTALKGTLVAFCLLPSPFGGEAARERREVFSPGLRPQGFKGGLGARMMNKCPLFHLEKAFTYLLEKAWLGGQSLQEVSGHLEEPEKV